MTSATFVFLTDQAGLSLTEHAAACAVFTQHSIKSIVIFCIGFRPPLNNRFQRLAKDRGFDIDYRAFKNSETPEIKHTSHGAHAHVTSAALLKMAVLDSIHGEFDRAVYLDGDVLLMQDFDLEKIDFQESAIAAVYDIARCGSLTTERGFQERCAIYGRSPHYFNSGVIVINYGRWSSDYKDHYNQAVIEHESLCEYKANCSCRDQCAWNRTFEKAWGRLPLTLNLQACAIFSKLWEDAAVRHYVGPQKFIPFRAWRNDLSDVALLNRARNILGLPSIGFKLAPIAKFLNNFRNWRFNNQVEAAILRVESLYNKPL